MINWGIIGLGVIGEKFASAFTNLPNAKLIGLASRDIEKLKTFKNKFNIDKEYCFNDYKSLIDCDKVDAIYIALPHNYHYEWILKCLESNKSVLTEKPATVNLNQINEINNYLDKNKIFFAEGFMYRYHPQTTEIIKIIRDNLIGELIKMESYFGLNLIMKRNIFGFKRIKMNKNHRLFNKSLAGGCIFDLGCYPSSMSILISDLKSKENPLEIILKNKKVEFGPTQVDIDSYTELDFQNNFKSYIGCSFKKNIGKKTKIFGTKGTIEIEDSWHCSPVKINLNGKFYEYNDLKYENIFSYEIESVSQSIMDGNIDPKYPAIDRVGTARNIEILDKWQNIQQKN